MVMEMSLASSMPSTESKSSPSAPKSRPIICKEMRTEAPPRQESDPRHGEQSEARKVPAEKVHVPSGQMVQPLEPKSEAYEPDGHEKHAAKFGCGPKLPGSHLLHNVLFACPTAGW
jgi:hypothetical protein